jgi:hypothetical protein
MLSTAYMTVATPAAGWGWALPSRLTLLGAAALLGICNQLLTLPGLGSFVMMPLVHGSLPFDVCFFTCGVIAKRCNWLDSPLPHKWFFASLSGGLAALWLAAMAINYSQGGGLFMLNKYGGNDLVPPDASLTVCRDPRKLDDAAFYVDPSTNLTVNCGAANAYCTANGTWQPPCGEQPSAMDFFAYSTPCCSGVLHANSQCRAYKSGRSMHDVRAVTGPDPTPSFYYAAYAGFALVMGLFAVSFSVTILQFSRDHLNVSTKFSAFLGSGAYTVYLIHPWVVTPLTWAWVEILRNGGTKIVFPTDSSTSASPFDSDAQVWLGFCAVGSLSLLLLWSIAHVIRSLPGLNQVL